MIAPILADASADSVYGKDIATGLTSLDNVYTTGQSFSIEIDVVNAAALYGASIGIKWDPAVLQCNSFSGSPLLLNGPPSSPGGLLELAGAIDNVAGEVTTWGFTRKGGVEIAGSGILGQAEFTVLAVGETWINITVIMSDALGTETDSNAGDVWFKNIPPPPPARACIVDFTQVPVNSPSQPMYYLYNGTTVTYTAIVTQQAFDEVTMTYYNPTIFEWTFWNPGTSWMVVYNTTIPTTDYTFDCTTAELGEWQIKLRGYAAGMEANHPELAWSSQVSRSNWIVLPAMGAVLDEFSETERAYGYTTEFIGVGPNHFASAYSLDEEVTLFANLTYNGGELQSRLVSWEIRDPNGNVVGTRTSMTNTSGTATTSFRILTLCGNASYAFGIWNVTAKSTIGEVPVQDSLPFKVYYTLTLGYIEGFPVTLAGPSGPFTNTFAKGSLVYVNTGPVANYAFEPRTCTITVTLFDELGVPIAFGSSDQVIPGAPLEGTEFFCNPGIGAKRLTFVFEIPKWAYTGNGLVVVNCFTKPLAECGTSWCPEISTPIIITNP